MEDIEIGKYVRTEKGYIGKIIQKENDYIDGKFKNISVCLSSLKRGDIVGKVIKHSKNIIDLIKEGDYINGAEVLGIYIPRDAWDTVEIRLNDRYTNFIIPDQIKTILTKEQYERNCYKLEEIENE